MNVQKIKHISSIFQSREGKNKLTILKSICKEVLFFGVAQVCRSWFYMVRNMYRRWYVNYLLAKYGTVLAGDSTLPIDEWDSDFKPKCSFVRQVVFEDYWKRVLKSIQGSEFKFELGSTCTTRCKFFRCTAEILGGQLKIRSTVYNIGSIFFKRKSKKLNSATFIFHIQFVTFISVPWLIKHSRFAKQ